VDIVLTIDGILTLANVIIANSTCADLVSQDISSWKVTTTSAI
jgi:hypothetical protein